MSKTHLIVVMPTWHVMWIMTWHILINYYSFSFSFLPFFSSISLLIPLPPLSPSRCHLLLLRRCRRSIFFLAAATASYYRYCFDATTTIFVASFSSLPLLLPPPAAATGKSRAREGSSAATGTSSAPVATASCIATRYRATSATPPGMVRSYFGQLVRE